MLRREFLKSGLISLASLPFITNDLLSNDKKIETPPVWDTDYIYAGVHEVSKLHPEFYKHNIHNIDDKFLNSIHDAAHPYFNGYPLLLCQWADYEKGEVCIIVNRTEKVILKGKIQLFTTNPKFKSSKPKHYIDWPKVADKYQKEETFKKFYNCKIKGYLYGENQLCS